MKRIITCIACIAAISGWQQAEAKWNLRYDTDDVIPVATLGVKVGAQMQYLSGSTPWNKTFNTGVLGGAFLGVHQKAVGGRIEANVRSVEYRNVNTGARVKIANFDVPVLFEVRPIKEIKIHLGPQVSVFPIVEDRGGNDIKSYFSSQEISLVFGLEGDLPVKLVAGARVVKGLTDINDSALPGKWTTTSAQFYVGYRFL